MQRAARTHRALRIAATALALAVAGMSCGTNQQALAARTADEQPAAESPPAPRPDDYRVDTRFVGSTGFSDRRLLRTIEDYVITLGRSPDRTTILIDAEFDLEDLYRQNGYPSVEIEHEVTVDDAARTVDLVFEIQEGPLVTVEVQVEGVTSFSVEDDIMPLWIRRVSGALGLGDPLFVEADLQAFAKSIVRFYQLRGYRDVRVEGPTILFPELDFATAKVSVTENEPSRLAQIDFSPAIRAVLGEARCEELERAEGDVAAAERLDSVRRAVISDLLESGYPNPSVRPLPSVDPDDPQSVRLLIDGEPGRRGRITEVLVRGNEATTQNFIESNFDFEIGDWFDGNAMDQSRRDLYLTGLFTSVEFGYEWIGDEALRLTIDVVEEESRTIDVLLGYGSYERLRGMVRFEERNLFGTGNRLAVEGRASLRGERGLVTLTNPRLFGTRTELTVGGDIFRREEPAYTDRAIGVTTALSRNLGEGFKIRTGYTFRARSGSVTDLAADLDDFTQGNAFVEFRVDRRDSILYPREGFAANLQFDADNPALGSDVDFQRLRLSVTGYVPVYRKLNLALRASTGLLWPGEGSDRIPIQERFFNGGEGTVRSFREAQLGPIDSDGRPAGGDYQNLFTAELRVPLRGLLEGALFVDAGNVGSEVSGYGLSNLRFGVGTGLRFNLPIGPIRVDGAFNPDRVPGEDEWVVHLSVGYPF